MYEHDDGHDAVYLATSAYPRQRMKQRPFTPVIRTRKHEKQSRAEMSHCDFRYILPPSPLVLIVTCIKAMYKNTKRTLLANAFASARHSHRRHS